MADSECYMCLQAAAAVPPGECAELHSDSKQLATLRDMNGSLEDAQEALGRVAAEIDEVATNWATVDEQSPGPALLRNWRAQIVFSLMVLREHPPKHPKLPSRT